jgi:transcriptional regulator with XRE-family HTH domain
MKSKSLSEKNNAVAAKNLPAIRAKRLKRVRNLANLSREELCADGTINRHTLIGWETGRFAGLTFTGAEKVIEKITEKGVHCSIEWLMDGIGAEPSVNPISAIEFDQAVDLPEKLIMDYELACFKAKNPQAVSLIVADERMAPQYQDGDIVAGKKRTGAHMAATIGYDCIVETEQGEVLLCHLRKGKYTNTYTLACNNPSMQKKAFVRSNIKLIFSAPVIWHRRKDIL